MSKSVVSCDIRDIKSEASAWIAQLETGELSGADLEAFQRMGESESATRGRDQTIG